MRNPLHLLASVDATGHFDLFLSFLLVAALAGLAGVPLTWRRRHRRRHRLPDAEPGIEILEPADEAAETVGVGERVRLRVTLARETPGGRVVVEAPDGVVEASVNLREAEVALELRTPGRHKLRIRVLTPEGELVADESLPLRVIRYEDAIERAGDDDVDLGREDYLAHLRRRAAPRVRRRGSAG